MMMYTIVTNPELPMILDKLCVGSGKKAERHVSTLRFAKIAIIMKSEAVRTKLR